MKKLILSLLVLSSVFCGGKQGNGSRVRRLFKKLSSPRTSNQNSDREKRSSEPSSSMATSSDDLSGVGAEPPEPSLASVFKETTPLPSEDPSLMGESDDASFSEFSEPQSLPMSKSNDGVSPRSLKEVVSADNEHLLFLFKLAVNEKNLRMIKAIYKEAINRGIKDLFDEEFKRVKVAELKPLKAALSKKEGIFSNIEIQLSLVDLES